ncbi:uncharacterized protein LOC115622635 isoform X1 [Scaptodrosophila lebanonensis]|uniref:Uncharacterized protein LOC115622635 isoform X1 n=1 Tax=Drosophila lebanonensis TaxID=7225 RepID=A0A6J2TC13_DROLE|nr:uncharacterized protein LOC115622635 isoform X1 [Scaptodrosophila lebanonensis]
MRPKEHYELIFDVIPRLYDINSKVFITNLNSIEEQLKSLPLKFCKMYTTRPLSDQLKLYLSNRSGVCLSPCDFHIVEEMQPFMLRLINGRVLEVMMCAGNELGNSLVLLIRRPQDGRLIYFYSAVQQDDLGRLLGQSIFNEWIAGGTDLLFLNLKGAERSFSHVDFDAVAADVVQYGKEHNSGTVVKLPLFGWEHVVRQLALRLPGKVRLMGSYERIYRCLGQDMRRFEDPYYAACVYIYDQSSYVPQPNMVEFPLKRLLWSPLPTRINLIQLCSLLRPDHISGIVQYHDKGNVPPAPTYLQRYRATFKGSSAPADAANESRTQQPAAFVANANASEALNRKTMPTVFPVRRAQICYDGDESDESDL